MGTEAGILAGYKFQGMVVEGDGADDEGKMKAGFCCLEKGNMKGCIRVGREEEGTRSRRPELVALEIAPRQAVEKEDAMYLCETQSVLTEVNGWLGKGGKATLSTTTNVDIMREVLCTLRTRITQAAPISWSR